MQIMSNNVDTLALALSRVMTTDRAGLDCGRVGRIVNMCRSVGGSTWAVVIEGRVDHVAKVSLPPTSKIQIEGTESRAAWQRGLLRFVKLPLIRGQYQGTQKE